MPPSVLLIACPWKHPGEPVLGLALLGGILQEAGVPVSCLYATLLYPRPPTTLASTFLDRYGGLLFAPWVEGGPSAAAARDAILSRYTEDVCLQGVRCERAEAEAALPSWLPRAIDQEIERAGQWAERAATRVLQLGADVLGLSVTFESQLPASIALLQRVKALRPALPAMIGGAACQAEQARGILASFPQLDAACYSEGEAVVAGLARALAGEGPLKDVPGIVYRDDEGGIHETPPPALCRDLDALPVPRYDDFFAQLEASEWRDLPVRLPFETSRGCWWGQKHLCTFCGLNGEGISFRAKTPGRAYAEIRALYEDYPRAHYLIAADNIIAMAYFTELLPQLAELPRAPGRPLQIFYEIKANLQPEQVALLGAAGIRTVQPGIESFSDEVLRLMDKGCTGLGQVQFLKWAFEAGVGTNYNLLLRNPGESAESYREMLELIPSLHHLPPPDSVVLTELERFSMYHRDPARYGLRNLRPQPFYRSIFPDPRVDLSLLAYQFDYDHPVKEDAELRRAHRALCQAVDLWRGAHAPGVAYYLDRGDHLVLVDRRNGARRREEVLGGAQAQLYRYLDRQRTLPAIRRRFPELEEELVIGLLERWRHARILCASSGAERRFLSLLPRSGPALARAPAEKKPRRVSLEVRSP